MAKKNKNKSNQKTVDVLVIYQDRDMVRYTIEQAQSLGLKLHTLKFGVDHINDIIAMAPKIILLSSNNILNTIKFYIQLLESHDKSLAQHAAIVLINNKELECAYLACENGLFDNYVVINPLNEPQRLKLVLIQALKLIEINSENNLTELTDAGEEELAACISHGVLLKNSLQQQLTSFKNSLADAALNNIDNPENQAIIQRVVELTFQELQNDMSIQLQSMLTQMIDAKAIQAKIKGRVEHHLANVNPAKNKELAESINYEDLASTQLKQTQPKQTQPKYKLLIAEHSDLYSQLLAEMFDNSEYDYQIAKNGIDALVQFKEFNPDVILLSYNLAKIDGIEITKRIRETGSKVAIVAYSHHHEKSLIRRWVPLGLSGYILKPSTTETVLKTVTKAVKNPIEILATNKNNKIEWRPEYTIGNERIDEQHKILFSLINDFFNDNDPASIKILFDKLTDYIQLHFDSEEVMMAEVGYPKISQHMRKHEALVAKFDDIKASLASNDSEEHHKLGLFLYNWLAKHILQEDMDYKSYAIKQKN